jgi:galactokinase
MKIKENFPTIILMNNLHFIDLEKTTTDTILIKRARHVISEIERTQKAADALRNCDFERVSLKLLN